MLINIIFKSIIVYLIILLSLKFMGKREVGQVSLFDFAILLVIADILVISVDIDNNKFWYFVVRFLCATGARISEFVQIKVEHIKKGYFDIYSKGGKIRRIFIPQKLQEEILLWFKENNIETGFVFTDKYNNKLTPRSINYKLKVLAQKYGLNTDVVYPHSFRHRFAKSFLDRYNDIALLADLMGHESLETTRVYLRRTSSEQQFIVNKYIDW